MARALALTVLLSNLLTLNCQEEDHRGNRLEQTIATGEKQSYSFSYGVADSRTGDMKTVWETKEGDTVKGHYSVVQPDGSTKTVEYSTGPDTGFTAVINNEDAQVPDITGRSTREQKTMRDYERYYDYPEEEESDYHPRQKMRNKGQFDNFRDYSKKRPSYYPHDLESSDFTHSYSIKHPYDQYPAESHVGFNVDPNCKTKHKKENNENNVFTGILDHDITKQKYPMTSSDFKDDYEKFENFEFEKRPNPFRAGYKGSKFEDINKPSSSVRHSYPSLPDAPIPEKFYADDIPPRPKKKYRPNKYSEYSNDDNMDDYILVPKKKYKTPPKEDDYSHDAYDDYRPHYQNDEDSHEDRYRHPPHGSHSHVQKEVVRKVVKKRKPVINLLDIFDI